MVRLIDENRTLVGDLPLAEALERAQTAGLDLVEVAPNNAPPVARIVDIGRYRYEQNKKGHQKPPPALKEVQFRPTIAEGDYLVKRNHIAEFLHRGSRCKVSMRFRGRETDHLDIGFKLINRLVQDLAAVGHLDGAISRDGRQITLVMVPGAAKQTEA